MLLPPKSKGVRNSKCPFKLPVVCYFLKYRFKTFSTKNLAGASGKKTPVIELEESSGGEEEGSDDASTDSEHENANEDGESCASEEGSLVLPLIRPKSAASARSRRASGIRISRPSGEENKMESGSGTKVLRDMSKRGTKRR